MGHRQPDREIDDRADDEERNVQILGSIIQPLGGGLRRARPHVERAHAERDGQKTYRQPGQRPHRRFEDAPDHHAPIASRQILQHQNRHASERQAEQEHVTEQVRLQKKRRAKDRSHSA
jgi:hypothetical protein